MNFEDKARLWYKTLKPRTINTFIKFSKLFLTHFLTKRRFPKTTTHLMTIKQRKYKPLKDIFGIFNNEKIHMGGLFR